MKLRAAFHCSEGCPGEHSLWDPIYACPKCGALLEVRHDLDELKRRSAADWKALFDARSPASAWPLASGVWGKLEDQDIVSLGEGWSPLVPAPRAGKALGHEPLWIKQCGHSHSGSFKDLGMTVLVSAVRRMQREEAGFAGRRAEAAGRSIRNGRKLRAVACASTGDTSAALAAYCAAAGIPCAVLLPRGKISPAQLIQPLANGARVLSLDTDFDGCMKVVQALAAEGTVYLANSMNSLRVEGQKTVAIELAQQLGWTVPDWVFLPGGNLGNTAALAAGFELLLALGIIERLPKIGVVQVAAASPLYDSWLTGFEKFEPVTAGQTLATAIRIGAPVSARKAIRALQRCGGRVERVTEREHVDAARDADRAGFYTCPQTAVALAGLRKAVATHAIAPGERVVVLSTAHGLKFSELKMAAEEGELPGAEGPAGNRPIELDADVGTVRAALQ
jgi:threonine synthase